MYNIIMNIDFENCCDESFNKFEKLFSYFYKKTLKQLKIKRKTFLEVDIIDNDQIQKINAEYRNMDRITDVISFAFDDKVPGEPQIINNKVDFLGCVYISHERAKEQADELNNTFEKEMCFLFVHGLLHLLGYNHIDDDEAEIMYEIQRNIFKGEEL